MLSFLDLDGEDSSFILARKKSLVKSFSLAKMADLFQLVDLSVYIYATDRHQESVEILDYISDNISFSGNYNIWSPVGFGLCFSSQISRVHEEWLKYDLLISKLKINPFHAPISLDAMKQEIVSISDDVKTLKLEKFNKIAYLRMSRNFLRLSFFLETSGGTFIPLPKEIVILINDLQNEIVEILQEKL